MQVFHWENVIYSIKCIWSDWNFCSKGYLSFPLPLDIRRKQECQWIHVSELMLWMKIGHFNERAQSTVKEIKFGVKNKVRSWRPCSHRPSARKLPYVSSWGMQVHFARGGLWALPPQRVGKGRALCSQGHLAHPGIHCFYLTKGKWPGASLLVLHLPTNPSSLPGLICTSKCECLPPAPGQQYLSTVSVLFLRRKCLLHKRAMAVFYPRSNYMLVSFKWLLKPQIIFTPFI